MLSECFINSPTVVHLTCSISDHSVVFLIILTVSWRTALVWKGLFNKEILNKHKCEGGWKYGNFRFLIFTGSRGYFLITFSAPHPTNASPVLSLCTSITWSLTLRQSYLHAHLQPCAWYSVYSSCTFCTLEIPYNDQTAVLRRELVGKRERWYLAFISKEAGNYFGSTQSELLFQTLLIGCSVPHDWFSACRVASAQTNCADCSQCPHRHPRHPGGMLEGN